MACCSRPSPHGARTFQRSARGASFPRKVDCRILLGFGRWRIFGALGGTQCVPSHSEVVFEIAGNRRSRKRPQSHLGHNGSHPNPKSPTRNFGTRRRRNRRRISMVAREAVAGDDGKCFRNQQKIEGRNPTVLPLETLSFWSLVLQLRELAAGWRVAQGRHLMVPELSSGAPGAHHFLEK